MDRRALAILVVAGCGGKPAPKQGPGLPVDVVARGTLGYAVAFGGEHLLAIELGERFELVVREADGSPEIARIDLGGPDRDWTALAVARGQAWVGGEGGEVLAIDLEAAAIVDRWPIGAAVTALAAVDDAMVAIGDAEGVLCLRRADGGALLQCVTAHGATITAIEPGEGTVISHAGAEVRSWHLPGLAIAEAVDGLLRWNGDEIRVRGARVESVTAEGPALIVEMAGAVQDIAVGSSGQLAVAAWISALDQASVVLVSPP